MEGPGASSPAAELATRGLDSADEEPELPSPVQDFIRRVGETGWSDGNLYHPILSSPEIKDFFPEDAPLSTHTGWRSQVRLRVLESIGTCRNSCDRLDVGGICGDNISRLTASEWEIVLRGFRSSSVLRGMEVDKLIWSSEADLESLGLQLGIILNTSSVTDLILDKCRLTARFFLNLASGLRENSHSKLKSLALLDAWGDAHAVKFIGEVLTGHHQLEILSLGSYSIYDIHAEFSSRRKFYQHVDEADARLLSQALKQNSCLKILALYGVQGKCAALLLNALAGDDGNRSIERLELPRMYGIGKCLAEVFISNRSLRVVTLKAIDMPVEEWRLLGEAIRDNATATTVNAQEYITYRGRYRYHVTLIGTIKVSKALEELSCAASSDGKEPVLHLEIVPQNEEETMSALNLLGSVLQGEINSIKSFCLHHHFPSISGGNRKSTEGILSMNGKTGETSVLTKLKLKLENENIFRGIWKQQLQCLRGNTSVTSLFLSFDGGIDERFQEEFRDLMALLQVNLTLREIDVSRTPWARYGKAPLIKAALKQNQQRAVYMSVFTEAKLQFGDAKAGRLFLCGSPKAGKTQLRRTLMKII